MDGQILIALLNPALALLLAGAFLALWWHRRDQTYVLVAACSYALLIMGFLLHEVGPQLPHELQRVGANLFFLLTSSGITVALFIRYGLIPPYPALALIVAASMSVLIWFLVVEPNLVARIYAACFGLSATSMLAVIRLRNLKDRHSIDRLLYWVVALSSLNFMLRPLIIHWSAGSYDTAVGLQTSLYWSTVQLTQAVITVAFGLTLMVAVAIDLMNETRREADTDKLSGLLNRRGFEAGAQAALDRCQARGQPAALILADLDHFKQINDGYGHPVGDSIIALFGDMLRQFGDDGVVAGRIGGEEFALMLPDAGLGPARILAERLRLGLPLHVAGRLPPQLTPSVSLGVCAAARGDMLQDLVRRADTALYEAKRAGRNRVVAVSGDASPAQRIAHLAATS